MLERLVNTSLETWIVLMLGLEGQFTEANSGLIVLFKCENHVMFKFIPILS